ncbi:hypothetical protein GOBAR_DD12375 [Gossypium barbadense]|nr:hypothetical protein GOBAR_DD12375 [Gossypium barbadense]
MPHLPLIAQRERRKRIGIALTLWLEVCRIAIWFLSRMGASLSLQTYRPRIRSYTLDFYAKRDYVKRLVYASDETCIEQVRMNRTAFFNYNCLGALDGTHIKIRVPTVDKPRYRTRKGDIATNMLGVCTPEMQFVYVLPGWKGCYYLVDAGYTNCEGFLAPFKGQRYHLNEWRQGYQPSSPQEFFNMKHASAHNYDRCSRTKCFFSSFSRNQKKMGSRRRCSIGFLHGGPDNVGTFNADTGFKAGYLNELERMLQKVLPNAMLKTKPNIESRIRLLKREWSIVYDMFNGQNNSGFGWDEHRQLVVAEDAVWDSYLKSHKEAAQFKHRSSPYYNQLTTIYARDRATGKDAQTAADVLEEINAEGVHTTGMDEERNSFYDCEADISLDDMDVSTAEPQRDRNQGGSSSSNKRKKKSDARDMSCSFDEAATLLSENIKAVGDQISRSIASEVVVQQKSEEYQKMEEKASILYSTLWEIEGLTDDQRYRALLKIPQHPTQMIVFFSLPSVARLECIRRFLSNP